jgi:ABC-type sugar transport system ATPase subunit
MRAGAELHVRVRGVRVASPRVTAAGIAAVTQDLALVASLGVSTNASPSCGRLLERRPIDEREGRQFVDWVETGGGA